MNLDFLIKETSETDWQKGLQAFLYFFGTVQILAGVIFFFAFNWDDLDKWDKFALIGGAELITFTLWGLRKTDDIIRDCFAFAAMVLIGAFMAVYGQIYQTGADAYELFLGWCFFGFFYMVAGRSLPLVLLWITLAYTAALLYLNQVHDFDHLYGFMSAFFPIQGAIIALLALLARNRQIILPPALLTCLLVVALLSFILGGWTAVFVMVNKTSPDSTAYFLLALAFYLCFVWAKKFKEALSISITLYGGLVSTLTCLPIAAILKNANESAGNFFSVSFLLAIGTYIFTAYSLRLVRASKGESA